MGNNRQLGAIGGNDPLALLVEMLAGGGPSKVIPEQEKAGQRELAATGGRLPIRGTTDDAVKRAQWEAAGFVFGQPIPEGKRTIFVEATFPAGWKLVPRADHAMWSDVVDGKGRKRASVFFKAAFYDYNAHTFGLEPRYRSGSMGGYDGEPLVLGLIDAATETVVHKVWDWSDSEMYYADPERDAREAEAKKMLAELYPDHKNPTSYWD